MLDEDGSGTIELDELNTMLRKLQACAAPAAAPARRPSVATGGPKAPTTPAKAGSSAGAGPRATRMKRLLRSEQHGISFTAVAAWHQAFAFVEFEASISLSHGGHRWQAGGGELAGRPAHTQAFLSVKLTDREHDSAVPGVLYFTCCGTRSNRQN